ncbi:MAG: hypothetical protein RL538_625 [Candidatus Parcubacteria bacterium]|jgi:hypothetical protein
MKKFLKYTISAVVVVALGAYTFGYFVIRPQQDREECSKKTLDYITEESKKEGFYSQELRDKDYEFFYRACAHARGYDNL